jgi:hypothetical protein
MHLQEKKAECSFIEMLVPPLSSALAINIIDKATSMMVS